jgi:hypothetical protein
LLVLLWANAALAAVNVSNAATVRARVFLIAFLPRSAPTALIYHLIAFATTVSCHRAIAERLGVTLRELEGGVQPFAGTANQDLSGRRS